MPDGCLSIIGFTDYVAGRYEQALSTFRKIANPRMEDQACIAACYAQLGHNDDARTAAKLFLERARAEFTVFPGKDTQSWRAYWLRHMPFKDEAPLEHLLGGLRKAGLPD